MAELFVISDTHFHHSNIIRYCDRPFADADEMDEKMIANWNSVVTPQDHVYHLGDVYFTKNPGKTDALLSRLNGKKRLVLGNHDKGKDQILQKHFQKILMWRPMPDFGLILSHVPIHEGSLNPEKWPVNVHGHIHDKVINDPRYKNVSVEQINYTPVNIEDLRVK